MAGIVHKSVSRGFPAGRLFIRSRMVYEIPHMKGVSPLSSQRLPSVHPKIAFLSRFVPFHENAVRWHSIYDLSKIQTSIIADPYKFAEQVAMLSNGKVRVAQVPVKTNASMPVIVADSHGLHYSDGDVIIMVAGKWCRADVFWPYTETNVNVSWKDHMHVQHIVSFLLTLAKLDFYMKITNSQNGERAYIDHAIRQTHSILRGVSSGDVSSLANLDAKYGMKLHMQVWGPDACKATEKARAFFTP